MGSEQFIRTFIRNEQIDVAERILWKALDIRKLTGRMPKTLAEMGIPTEAYNCYGGVDYSSGANSFTLTTKELNSSGFPLNSISFPLSSTMTFSYIDRYKKQLADFASGKIQSDGNEKSSKSSGGPRASYTSSGEE
jgi:hypothetical protein